MDRSAERFILNSAGEHSPSWVAMWRPIEILLYEHWESHLDHAELDRLARIPVDYSSLPDASF